MGRGPGRCARLTRHAASRSGTTASTERPQTLGEEIANALTHGAGVLLAAAALPVLVVTAARHGGAAEVVGAGVFGATMVLLYAVSTLYHALPAGRAKAWFARFDHAAIYVFIAGSYMPWLLGALRGAWGWSLFGVVWGAAALGVVAKLANRLRHPFVSTGLYVAMGWVALAAAGPLVERVALEALGWLVAGGLAYTLGAAVFLVDSRIRYAHAAWHGFVLAGSACHVGATLAAA